MAGQAAFGQQCFPKAEGPCSTVQHAREGKLDPNEVAVSVTKAALYREI